MITRFGIGKLGPVALGNPRVECSWPGYRCDAFLEDTASTIDQEVYDLVDVAYKRATKVLSTIVWFWMSSQTFSSRRKRLTLKSCRNC